MSRANWKGLNSRNELIPQSLFPFASTKHADNTDFDPLSLTLSWIIRGADGVTSDRHLTGSLTTFAPPYRKSASRKGRGDSRKKAAFTLAEVLITLGIIGVVAAMTIPNLITKNAQRTYVIQYRKAYSDIANSLRLMQEADEYFESGFAFEDQPNEEYEYLDKLTKHMKRSRVCHAHKSVEEGCLTKNYPVYRLDGTLHKSGIDDFDGGAATALLQNGTLLAADLFIIIIDVNNSAGPNTIGKDIFFVLLNPEKFEIRPAIGRRQDWGVADGVRVEPTIGDGTCQTADRGYGCSAWYMTHMP